MTEKQWRDLQNDPQGTISQEDLARGWHWCWEWDGLLVGPSMPEWGDDKTQCRCGNHLDGKDLRDDL